MFIKKNINYQKKILKNPSINFKPINNKLKKMNIIYKTITFLDKTFLLILLIWSPYITYNSFYYIESHNKTFQSFYFGIFNIIFFLISNYLLSFFEINQSLINKIFEFSFVFIFFIQIIIWFLQFVQKDKYLFVYLFHDFHFLVLLENLRFASILIFVLFYWIFYKKTPGVKITKKIMDKKKFK